MTENRRFPRLYRRFILRAAAFGENPLRWSFVTIHNLSPSGIFFTYDRPVYVGMMLHFKIDFPDRVIECMGRVVRAGSSRNVPQDIAARLEGVDPQEQQYIESFVRQSLP